MKTTPETWLYLQQAVLPLWKEGKSPSVILESLSPQIVGFEDVPKDPGIVALEQMYIALLASKGLKPSDGFAQIFTVLNAEEQAATGEAKLQVLSFGLKIKTLADQIRDNYTDTGSNKNATDATGEPTTKIPIYRADPWGEIDQEDIASIMSPAHVIAKPGVLAPDMEEKWLAVIRSEPDQVFVEIDNQEIAFSRDNIIFAKVQA